MSEQDDINKRIADAFMHLQDNLLLSGLGAVSTANSKPSEPLTMDKLQEAIDAIQPETEYMFFMNMNSVLSALRLFRKQGLRWKRVKGRNWIKVYKGLLFLGDIYIDRQNNFESGKIGRIKKDKLTLKFDKEFKTTYQPFIETGFRSRYRWGK